MSGDSRSRSVLAWVGLLTVFLPCVSAAAQPVASDTAAFADVEAELRAYVDRQKAPVGIVAGVLGPRGRRLFSYGQTDCCKQADCSVSAHTLFQIDSVTKLFTALLLADLVEEGLVDLDDPVEEYLPITVNLPEPEGRAVTLRHLATHTSGLPRLPPNLDPLDNLSDPYADYTVNDLYRALNGGAFESAPGEEYRYSNYAYGLLGHALTRAAGAERYEAAVTQRLLQPLGMTDTRATFEDAPTLAARRARGHTTAGRPAGDWHATEATAGAGSLWSDASDLLDFLAANLHPKEAPPPLRAALARTHEEQQGGGGSPHVALGWHIRELDGRRYYWHNGGSRGFRSFVGFSAEQEVGVVVLGRTDKRYFRLHFAPLCYSSSVMIEATCRNAR